MNEDKLKKLNDLFNDTLDKFNAIKDAAALKDSFPIMWFGDLEAYAESNCRIVTIALNPSCMEFVEERFEGAEEAIKARNFEAYRLVLNEYFKKNPYKKWFNAYNQVLNYLNASYGGKMSNKAKSDTAIQLDFVPIATCPKWGDLSPKYRNTLLETYSPHLKKTLNILDPNIIIMSVNKSLVYRLFKDVDGHEPLNKEFANDNNYIRYYRLNKEFEIDDNGKHKLIWGRCQNVPFGAINKSKRDMFFKNIKNK